MLSFKELWESYEDDDYRGEHHAPTKSDSTAPLWNLVDIYPDIYSNKAFKYYGGISPLDNFAITIMLQYKNKPNRVITIYRAVPSIDIPEEKEIKIKIKNANKTFPKVDWTEMGELGFKYNDIPKYIEYLYNRLETLKDSQKSKKLQINSGDWVTTVKKYAIDHGLSTLNGKYKILSKKVYARDLFTDGNSVFEFGYDPQPKVE